jgi:ribosomal protein L24
MDDDLAQDRPAPEKTQLGRNSSLSASLSDFDVDQLRALAARFDNRSLEEEERPVSTPTPIQPKPVQWARVKSGAYKGRLALITIPDEEYLVVPLPDEKMRESMVRAKRSAQFIETAIERFRRGLEFGLFKVNLKQQLANKPGSKTTDFLSTSNVSRTGEELAGFDQPHPRITNMCLDEPTSAMQPGDRVTVHAGPSAGKSGYLVMVCALPGQDQNVVTIGVIREAYNKYESLMYTARDGRSVGTGLEDDLVVHMSNLGRHILTLP